MSSRFLTLCAMAALTVGLSACAGTSEPGRTAAARGSDAHTADALARIAHQSLDAGDATSAASMLKRAHEINPRSPEILAELGRTLGSLDAWTEAAEAYRKAVALAPKDAAIHRSYGGALLALNQPELAEQEYRAAIDIKKEAASLCGLGVTLDLQGRHEEAEAAFRSAYQLDPQSPATRTNLALSLALWGASNEAIGLLAPMAAAPDADSKQRQNLALVFGLAGEIDQAAAVARIDLGEEAVRSNLAYYETLQAMPPVLRVRAIMGASTQPPLPPRKPQFTADGTDTAPEPKPSAPAVAPQPQMPVPSKSARTAARAPTMASKITPKPAEQLQPPALVEAADVTTHVIVAVAPEKGAVDMPPPNAQTGDTVAEAHVPMAVTDTVTVSAPTKLVHDEPQTTYAPISDATTDVTMSEPVTATATLSVSAEPTHDKLQRTIAPTRATIAKTRISASITDTAMVATPTERTHDESQTTNAISSRGSEVDLAPVEPPVTATLATGPAEKDTTGSDASAEPALSVDFTPTDAVPAKDVAAPDPVRVEVPTLLLPDAKEARSPSKAVTSEPSSEKSKPVLAHPTPAG